MIDNELINMIDELESVLKKDKRFKANGDNHYRKQIRKIYQTSQYGRKPIDLTNLVGLNRIVDIGDIAYLNYINKMLDRANHTLQTIINN